MVRTGNSLNGKDGVLMAKAANRGGLLPMLAALLIALPGLLVVARTAPGVADASPALDRFLIAVREATPPSARILSAGNPPGVSFYRATYLLYPRVVYSAFATDYEHGWHAPAARWSDLRRLARRDGASYVLLWSLPLRSHGLRVVNQGVGTLVRVRQ